MARLKPCPSEGLLSRRPRRKPTTT
jgi:hypothetical protein